MYKQTISWSNFIRHFSIIFECKKKMSKSNKNKIYLNSKPNYRDNISPKNINQYIKETQLLLECAKDYQNNGSFKELTKILERTQDNIIYLATLNDIHNSSDIKQSIH